MCLSFYRRRWVRGSTFCVHTHIEPINTTGRRSCEATFEIEILTSSITYASSQTGFDQEIRQASQKSEAALCFRYLRLVCDCS